MAYDENKNYSVNEITQLRLNAQAALLNEITRLTGRESAAGYQLNLASVYNRVFHGGAGA